MISHLQWHYAHVQMQKSHVFHILSFSGARTVKLNQITYQNRGAFCETGCISAALHLPVVADAAWHWPKANLPLFALSSAVSKDTRILKHLRDAANSRLSACTRHNKTRGDGKVPKKRACGFSTLKLKLTGRAIMKPQCACAEERGQKFCISVTCKWKSFRVRNEWEEGENG